MAVSSALPMAARHDESGWTFPASLYPRLMSLFQAVAVAFAVRRARNQWPRLMEHSPTWLVAAAATPSSDLTQWAHHDDPLHDVARRR
jgi:hypothetical protein